MSGAVALKRGQRAKPKPAPRRTVHKPVPVVRLPLSVASLRRYALIVFAPLALAATLVGLTLAGLPQAWWQAAAHAAGRAGFEVRHVEVSGVQQAPRLPIYAAALDGPTNSMLLVNLDTIRDRLRKQPWVADASVTRRLPDTLRVEIVERKPVALWQFQHKLSAIDLTGQPLTAEHLERYAQLPIVVGAGANSQVGPLLDLLAAQPALARQVDAATFVGTRRWDLRFKSGAILALPEGDEAALGALANFAALDRRNGLLDKGFARFDMRLPGRMLVRVGGDVTRPASVREVKI